MKVAVLVLSTAAARGAAADASSADASRGEVAYGPPSWYSGAHGCNRAAGEVWCGGACVLPSAFSSGSGGSSKLACPPANLASLPADIFDLYKLQTNRPARRRFALISTY